MRGHVESLVIKVQDLRFFSNNKLLLPLRRGSWQLVVGGSVPKSVFKTGDLVL